MATVAPRAVSHKQDFSREEKKVIFASSLGTVFEWYDFYLYAVLAPFFAALFFPTGNDTAALLSAFATYAAGFLVRPFGALVFRRIGDLVGRKYTFLVTILVMGFATFAVGLLPTVRVDRLGSRQCCSCRLRLLQGSRWAANTAAPQPTWRSMPPQASAATTRRGSRPRRRSACSLRCSSSASAASTGWLTPAQFADWGWRLPFLVSLVLLVFSIYIRLKLNEIAGVPADEGGRQRLEGAADRQLPQVSEQQIRAAGAAGRDGRAGRRLVHGAVLRAVLPARSRSRSTGRPAYTLIAISLVLGTPFFIVFGWLSDRIGRLKIILAGCLIAAVTYFPLFQALDALRQSGARDVCEDEPDHRGGEGLQLPHLRRTVVEVLRMRQGQGLPDQGGFVVHVDDASGGIERRRDHQGRRHRAQGLRRGGVQEGRSPTASIRRPPTGMPSTGAWRC